ncbi:hypothetical protein SH601_05430 [Gracilibacillus sp. S3-1-1]|uniref:Uncharacterized protein n=1 Tax=Gracilibacillus pellucidus TaxID=3095368 RepID=A0ACC6M3A0_9BACI|nr:hypothetical protein [Gracilibacillus sp. S3-1-1]MDX8045426.1 hypothetical protein [Gracilibacillus sp. S3-1-1]
MSTLLLQIASILGILFGAITFFIELKKKKREKLQLFISLGILISCLAIFTSFTFY